MKDKSLFKRLRLLIAAGSVIGFVGGWAMLAQADQIVADDLAPISQVITVTTPRTNSQQPAPTTGAPTITPTPAPTVTTPQQTTTQPRTTQTSRTRSRLRTGGS